ncbi:signal sequence receptor beta [Brevipalpus obovatus]|uniref:signal sequence receptor beta n=1 Tax=Brevipalpus obovatus TaxID=246614 RepID=UPI003D9E3153
MAIKWICLLIVLATVCVDTLLGDDGSRSENEATSSGRLLVEKKILNKYLVEGKDIIVNYNLFNIGESSAIDIRIDDASLPEEHFQVVSGLPRFTIPRLAGGQNMTHTVVFRPKLGVWGRFNFTSSEITYLPREEAKERQYGVTSEPGEGYIVSLKEFDRRFSPHIMDWIAFSVMSMPSLLIPFYLWFRSKSKYDAILAAKQTSKKLH